MSKNELRHEKCCATQCNGDDIVDADEDDEENDVTHNLNVTFKTQNWGAISLYTKLYKQ